MVPRGINNHFGHIVLISAHMCHGLDHFLRLIKCVHYLDRERRCNHSRLCDPVLNSSLIDDN